MELARLGSEWSEAHSYTPSGQTLAGSVWSSEEDRAMSDRPCSKAIGPAAAIDSEPGPYPPLC